MDIVKQRRKRLMAWILAIVLCVGMWQGSVYATEGDGNGTVSGSDLIEKDTTTPESEPTEPTPDYGVAPVAGDEVNYTVTVYFVDENGEDVAEYISGAEVGGIEVDGELVSWSEGQSGNTLKFESSSNTITGVSLKKTAAADDTGTETYEWEHNVIGWRQGNSGDFVAEGAELKLDSVAEIKTNDMNEIVSKTCNVYAVLGKGVVIYRPWLETDQYYEVTQYGIPLSGETFEVILKDDVEDRRDGIFAGWLPDIEEVHEGEGYFGTYTGKFDNIKRFEQLINLTESFSCNISRADAYTLYPGPTYNLLKQLTIKDEYTYSEGISFVLEGDKEQGIPVTFE